MRFVTPVVFYDITNLDCVELYQEILINLRLEFWKVPGLNLSKNTKHSNLLQITN